MRSNYARALRIALLNSSANETLAADLASLTADELTFLATDWQVWARDDQLAPVLFAPGDSPSSSRPPGAGGYVSPPGAKDDVFAPGAGDTAQDRKTTWLILGGRGSGKTRAGAEWIRAIAAGAPELSRANRKPSRRAEPARIALVGKTLADVRNVMVEGVSGLLAIAGPGDRPVFEPSKRRLTWPNGSVAELFSADEREALRGPQFSAAWCDELAKWRDAEAAWDMLQFGMRLGDHPQAVVTTTPRPLAFLKKLMVDAGTVTTRLSTADNAANLAPAFLAEMSRRYQHSDLGRQELYGEIVDESARSLWRRSWIENSRIAAPPGLTRIVVALDPPVTATASSDACGIVVAGLGEDGRAYVIADRTVQGREPPVWAKAAIAAYRDYDADRVVAEVNQGGDLVVGILRQFAPGLPVVKVRATRGKWLRAEPVAALYAEGRVIHAGRFEPLEDQMCAFDASGRVDGRSPDRLDALVWAITDLLLDERPLPGVRML